MLPVVLSWGDRTLKTKMLLDTGAGVSFILPWMARHLGLTIDGGDRVAPGAGGEMRVRSSKVDIRPAVLDTRGRPARCRRLGFVLVTEDDDTLPFPMLGRHPFFNWYDVEIKEKDDVFILKERRERSGGK
ncbi:MAG: hypothetical protein FJ149_11375 [Euryarchaeota archaeon]|nr:hypothetical protein [Euryarchaeota archaeon]